MFVSHLWSVKAVSGKMKQPINLSNSRQFKYCTPLLYIELYERLSVG